MLAMLPIPLPEETSTLVAAIVLGHVALVALLVLCLARQDTDPEWVKKQKQVRVRLADPAPMCSASLLSVSFAVRSGRAVLAWPDPPCWYARRRPRRNERRATLPQRGRGAWRLSVTRGTPRGVCDVGKGRGGWVGGLVDFSGGAL